MEVHMDALTRRKFLIASGVVGGGALAAGAGAYTLTDILATAGDPSPAPSDRTLVVVTLYGGNDGLNTVIPYADPAYQDARPELSYDAEQVLRLDDDDRPQPGAQGAAPALRRAGSSRSCAASATRSRTAATSARWTSGRRPTRTGPGNTGWLGRWLDTAGGDPRLRGVVRAGAAAAAGRRDERRRRGAGDRAQAGPAG